MFFGYKRVPLNLLANEEGCLNSAPNLDRSVVEPGWMIGLFELLNDLIMESYLAPFQAEI